MHHQFASIDLSDSVTGNYCCSSTIAIVNGDVDIGSVAFIESGLRLRAEVRIKVECVVEAGVIPSRTLPKRTHNVGWS